METAGGSLRLQPLKCETFFFFALIFPIRFELPRTSDRFFIQNCNKTHYGSEYQTHRMM